MFTFISFFGFTAFVAWYAWYKLRRDNLSSKDGYFLGGRSLSGIVIAGSIGSDTISNGGTDTYIFKTDLNGDSMYFENNFGYLDDEVGNAIIQTNDGGFAIIGSTISETYSLIDFIKTNPEFE